MQDDMEILPIAAKGLSATLKVILICSALSASISVYADWTGAALSITLIPDLLFSSLVEFSLFNAMFGRPVMGGPGGAAKYQRFLILYILISGLPMLLGALYGIAYASLEIGLLLVSLPLSIVAYGLLGTVFPAVIEDEAGGLGLAMARGRRQAGFVLPRIFGITVLTFMMAMAMFFIFNQVSGSLLLAATEGRVTTSGVVYEFLLQLLGNTFWAVAVATIVVAYRRESPSRIFE